MAILKPGQLASGSYTISGSFSGSFQGSGAGLNNIPSSAIVGLSSTQIASGAVTASVSTGTGSFTVTSGSSTFMFISSSGNVGLGTTTPSQPLTVNGVISAGATGGNLFTTVGGGISSYGQIGSNYYYTNSNTAFRKFNDFVSQLDFGSGGFYFKNAGGGAVGSSISFSTLAVLFNGGNFVVGSSTDAGYRLDVNGTARIQGNTLISSNNQLQFGSSFNNISSQGNAYLEFTNRAFKGVVLYNGQSIAESQKLLIGDFATFGVESSRYTSAMLIVESSTRGFLPPRTSTTSNISSPGQGLITYVNSGSNEGLYYYNSGSAVGWHKVLTNSGSQAISGSVNLDNTLYVTGSRVGIGTSTPSYTLDTSGYGRFTSGVVVNAGQRISLGGSDYGSDALYSVGGNPLDVKAYYYTRFTRVNANQGIQVIQVEGQALIKGAGTTSATTALLVQNANASASLTVKDDGSSTMLSSTETGLTIQHTNGNFASILIGNGGQFAPGQFGMYFNGGGVWSWSGNAFRIHGGVLMGNTNAQTFQLLGGYGGSTVGTSVRLASNTFNQGQFTATSGTQTTVIIGDGQNETWAPNSGNATYNLFAVAPRINTTGTYSGIVRGFVYSPVITSMTGVIHRAIETVTGDVLLGTTSGRVAIGTTADTGHELLVSGSGASGSVNLDNTLYVSGSRVGIGTSTPANTLDVRSSAASDGTNKYTGFTARIQNTKDGDTVNAVLLLVNQNGGNGGYYIRALNNQAGQERFYVNGNGGIYSINNGTFGGDLRATKLYWNTDNDGWIGDGGLDGTFMVVTNGTERYRVTPNGNLIINTTTDAGFKLDVNGTARVQGNTTFLGTIAGSNAGRFVIAAQNFAVNITSTNPTNGEGSLITTGAITTTDNQTKNVINVNNAVTSTLASFNTLNGFAFTSNINQTLGTIRGLFIAPTLTASTDFRAIETTTGSVILNGGNVGIGTSTPSASLHISGSSGSALLEIDSPAVNNILFVTGSGRVGIGTGTPTQALDVIGTARATSALLANDLITINNSAQGSNATILFPSNSPFFYANSYAFNFGATSNGGGAAFTNGVLQVWNQLNLNNLLILSDGNSTANERLRVTKGGNVLIGTTTDSGYKLDVNGDTKTLGLLTAYGISTNLSDMAIYNTTNNTGYIRFITQTASAQAERMRIPNTGNILINTTTDAGFRLDVNGTARIQNSLTVSAGGLNITGASTFNNPITAAVSGNRIGNFQFISSGNATTTGLGFSYEASTMIFQGYTHGAGTLTNQAYFGYKHYFDTTTVLNGPNSSGIIRVYNIGWSDGNTNSISGNSLWLQPIYNFTGARTGIIVRGFYYDPVLTSITNTTHRAIETTTGDVLLGTTSGRVAIGTSADTGHELLVSGSGASGSVNLDNTLYVSGSNVGIGTNTPGSALDIKQTTSIVRIDSSLVSSFHGIEFRNSPNLDAEIKQLPSSGEFKISNGRSVGWGGFTTFYTDTVERMRIGSNGNILINTTTDAGYKLDVNGTARVKGIGSTNSTVAFTVINSSGSELLTINDSNLATFAGGNGRIVTNVIRLNYINSANDNYSIMQANGSTGNAKFYQAISVGTSSDPVASAQLEVVSTTKGFLPPRMTGAQAELISSPAEGLMIYATAGTGVTITSKGWWGYDGATWVKLN